MYVEALLDSGSAVSLMPNTCFLGMNLSPCNALHAVNDTKIATHGFSTLPFRFGKLCTRFQFISTNLPMPILGADFLRQFSLSVDFSTGCIMKGDNLLHTILSSSNKSSCISVILGPRKEARVPYVEAVRSVAVLMPKEMILKRIGQATSSQRDILTLPLTIEHSIVLHDEPVQPRIYPLPIAYHEDVKCQFDSMLDKGIIEPSSSPYASPLVVVRKKNGTLRACVDYRALNNVTRRDAYTMKRVDQLVHIIKGKVFSVLDMKDGFHQIPVREIDREKTAVATPWGLFNYSFMPFGLKNASATFQRLMDNVLRGLSNVVSYIDDIIIFSENETEHCEHLNKVFDALFSFGLQINQQKSKLFESRVVFLGYEFSADGYRPPADSLPNIMNYATPKTKKELQRFIGMINYFRNHIHDLSSIAAPLYLLLSGSKKFTWGSIEENALEAVKTAFSQRVKLKPVNIHEPFTLYTDASGDAIGATLLQSHGVIGFATRRLSPVETHYPTFDRECLAIVWALKHYKYLIGEQHVNVSTDHKPLVGWHTRPPVSNRHSRWLVSVQEMDIAMSYIQGSKNVVADFLSRYNSVNSIHTICALQFTDNKDDIVAAQTDEFLLSITNKSPTLEVRKVGDVWCEMSLGSPRILLPEQFHSDIIEKIHTLGHYGNNRTYKTLSRDYYWPGMKSAVVKYIQQCDACQKNKPKCYKKRELVKFPASNKFHIIHIDIVGPLPISSMGNTYLLTIMDRFSGFPEAIPLSSITAEVSAKKLVETWIARYGVPEVIITDQGRQFESVLFTRMCSILGVDKRRSTAYHPQTNGKIERWHRTLKECLRCIGDRFADWEEALPLAMLSLRAAINEQGYSPFEVLFGESICLPHMLMSDKTVVDNTLPTYIEQLNSNARLVKQNFIQVRSTLENNVSVGQKVYLKIPVKSGCLNPIYSGPFNVLSFEYPVVEIDKDGKPYRVNMDRVKSTWDTPVMGPPDEEKLDVPQEKIVTPPRRSRRILKKVEYYGNPCPF